MISVPSIQHQIELHDSIAPAGAKSAFGIATGGCAALATGLFPLSLRDLRRPGYVRHWAALLAWIWFHCAVSAQAAAQDAPVHPVTGSFVREWLVLGPFPSRELNDDLLAGGESNVRPREGDAVVLADGTRRTWTRLRSRKDWVSLESAGGHSASSVTYAYCELQSDAACETDIRFSFTGPSSLWLNGIRAGSSSGDARRDIDLAPALPVRLEAGRNACLIKFQLGFKTEPFLFQPLPASRGVVELSVVASGGRIVPGAAVQFYEQGEVVARLKTDQSGRAVACLHPLAERYDVRVTAGDLGAWILDLSMGAGERRVVKAALASAASIAGTVHNRNGSPQAGIVVEAIRETEGQPPPRSDRPAREGRMASLLPKPAFSETSVTDTNGLFQFVNMRPGRYRLRAHGSGDFIDPEGIQGTDISGSPVIAVQPGRPVEGIRFQTPAVKKGIWKNYPIMQGLSELHPTRVHRTPDGLVWVGTDESFLYAYDGLEFQLMASVPEIEASHILSLEHAADGALWIGTSGGVSRRAKGKTETFYLRETDARLRVNDILAEADGTVWFATTSGLFQYDGRNVFAFDARNLPGDDINSLMRARDGVLWLGTSEGLARFDGAQFTLEQPFAGFEVRGALHLHQARDGAIWFAGALGGGVYRYDGASFTRLGIEDGLLSDVVESITETSDGALWFATVNGLCKFDGTTVVNYVTADGLSNHWVRHIWTDSDDVLWCANGWGVSRLDPRGFIQFGEPDGLRHGDGRAVEVYSIEPEPGGTMLIGTGWRGMFRSDGRGFEADPAIRTNSYVRGMHRGADGTLWFGTASGIMKREQEGGQIVPVLDRNWVIALCIDEEGNLWYGHGWNGGGLARFNPGTGEETVFGRQEGLPDEQVWAVAPASGGGVWVGTSAGLARYRDGRIEDLRDRLGIQTGGVFNLRRGRDDILWIGSRLGLHAMNEGRGDGRHPDWPAFTGRDWVNTAWEGRRRLSITITNGLPDQHVWCSARTSDGKIWMGTDRHGLLGYDGRAVTVLDKRDGMSGSMVLGLAATPDDSLWVGFLDGGVVRYRPSKARPSVRLRGVQVDGETLTNFTAIPKLTTGRRVTFQFQGIDQKTHPEKRQFWYRLMNASGRTVYSAVSKDRSFDWVPEERGAHTFEVQSIDRDLNYSEPAQMVMQVNVPWHANAWILGSLAGAFAGLLAWAFVARAMYQRKSREAIVLRERVRISRDLHDHLGAGLTHLAMMGDMVRQQAAQPDAVEMLAGRLTESARELTRTMGEVIWTTDPDKDTLRSFSLFLSSYAERFFSESSLRLRFEIPEQVPDMLLPSEFRSSLLTVTKEALNNVAKHSQATELRIKLDLRDRELHVSFEDNGRGFAMDEVALDRHGLVNMRERLRDLPGELRIESLEGQGTRVEIRCSLPKR